MRNRTSKPWARALILACLASAAPLHAEAPPGESRLTIGRLFGTKEFDPEPIPARRWSKRSSTYIALEKASKPPGRELVRHDPATGKKEVIVPAAAFIPPGAKEPLAVDGFEFSADESRLLVFTNSKRVWRRNTRGDYWLLDVAKRTLKKLGGDAAPSSLMFATFSPDGTQVAFVRDNNLFVQHLDTLQITPLTTDGSRTRINGTSDWVNEEELNLRHCFRWSPDSRHLLFWQFDTTGVSEFHLVDNVVSKSPRITSFAYPKVGEKNSATRLGVIPASGGKVRWLDLPGDPREHYLPHADWTPDGAHLLVQQFNRLQTDLRIYRADPASGQVKLLFTEKDSAWLENDNPWRWLQRGKSFLWLSERTGWRHAYRVPVDGSPLVPITQGNFDLMAVETIDEAGGWLYYAASPASATQRHLFRVKLDGSKTERISPEQPGWHEYAFSEDAKWAVHTWSNFTTPPVVKLVRLSDNTPVRTLTDNAKLRARLSTLERPQAEFLQVPIGEGVVLDGWSLRPAKVAPTARLPLLMYVYGEPHGQTVRDAWPGARGLWHWMLAQEGFVVASVDNRGTNVPRGRAWRKVVHRKVGILAPTEQAAAVRALLKRWPFVDPTRVGSWGWSGGGSMSLNALFRYPDLYRTAIAIAPVADQRLYDTIYQERYMGLPADNEAGYRDGSPLTHAGKLRGNLLLVHGTGDDNCHYQGTERLMEELIARGKRFSVLPYPNRSHAIREGRNTDQHLMETMTRFLRDNLLSPHAPAPDPVYETRTVRGWTLHIHRELLAAGARQTARAVELLDQQLGEIIKVVPKAVVAKLQRVPLYFNPEYPGVRPTAEYHPGAGWLRDQRRDPAMAKAVEFTNIRLFEAEVNRMPWFVLHELAHAYHDRDLPDGFGNRQIAAAFVRARDAGTYAKVERHLGNGRPNTREKAYALTNPMEYFAETTEAYFGRNDFFPFTRDELKKADPTMFALLGLLWEMPPAPPPPAPPAIPPTLTQQLLKESPADLARAARAQGDAGRGAVLFFQPFLTCARCHDAEITTRLGPDLALAGKEATAEYLIESVLLPSKQIKKGYEPLTVVTTDGRTITGQVVEEKAGTLTLIDPAGATPITLPTAKIEERRVGKQSLMPEGLINTLSDRQQFLDLAKYLIEVAEGGPRRARELRPAQTAFVVPEYEKEIDHAGLIQRLDAKAFQRGAAIYTRVCANCHGTIDQPGSLPTSPRFAAHTFKNGSDPYRLYRTLTHGYGQMAPQTWMVPRQKYDVIHYLREAYLRPHNPTQHPPVNEGYLASLPTGKPGAFGPPPASVEPWMAMDYGPSLMNTYEVGGPGPNIAYKGIAVRLDAGAGGVSRGRSWALFDHDTLRFAAAWTGDGFIDWKGIHFNGQHQVHPKLIGDRHIENPVGPGWADPETGRFTDPRPLGRDRRPYGPLPRRWARFQGTYAYGNQTVIAYTVGDAAMLELEGVESDSKKAPVFTRTLEVGRSSRDLHARIASQECAAAVVGDSRVSLTERDGFHLLTIPASATPTRVKLLLAKEGSLAATVKTTPAPQPLKPLTLGGPRRWQEVLKTTAALGKDDGPFAVDTFATPIRNPWNAQLRLTGFDFFPDGKRMAVCTWDGDVWVVSGIARPEDGLTWQRIASGLFQPLGLKFRDGGLFVCCRDQIVKLHDLNGDGETDFYECFNNDHQVTEHFHEFAMGLQTDAAGNFYYAKSGRHALPALVPHHGTLLKVSRDGSQTEILATGFRAANGVCLNPDGTFFVTDQEGFWTPKNRINKVEKGGFYGNLWGYTDITDPSDAAMKQPLCWITNAFDRSPAELIWVPANTWGPLAGTLLNTSYGMGKLYVVPHETVDGQAQGGMCALPLPTFPTGIIRPRFHPTDGHLYVCGMYAWAGNQTTPGGFYRVRYTGRPAHLPVGLKARTSGMEITFSDPLAPQSIEAKQFSVKVWGLKRSQNYGSKHIGEKPLTVTRASIAPDGKTVRLDIPDLNPTWCMEIRYSLQGADGKAVSGTLHNTIHALGK
ncbi:MAG: DPP IV N-terminal domain-containing protein [Gemmataceae bacterium]